MSATRCKKPHADILIGIEMTRERNLGIKKNTRYINDLYTCHLRKIGKLVQYTHVCGEVIKQKCNFCILDGQPSFYDALCMQSYIIIVYKQTIFI